MHGERSKRARGRIETAADVEKGWERKGGGVKSSESRGRGVEKGGEAVGQSQRPVKNRCWGKGRKVALAGQRSANVLILLRATRKTRMRTCFQMCGAPHVQISGTLSGSSCLHLVVPLGSALVCTRFASPLRSPAKSIALRVPTSSPHLQQWSAPRLSPPCRTLGLILSLSILPVSHMPDIFHPVGFVSSFLLAPPPSSSKTALKRFPTQRYRYVSTPYRASVTPTDPPSIASDTDSRVERRILETCAPPPWTLSFRGRRLYQTNHNGLEYQVLPPAENGNALSNSDKPLWRKLLDLTLLPAGFPHSVGSGYGHWVVWHIGRQTFRNAYYVLGTTSLLKALGLGTGQAVAVGASLKWVLKDGLGMTGKLGVSARLAGILDRDPKLWRVLGDSIMALAAGVEICSVLKPSYFLLFGALGGLLKGAASAMSGPSYRVFLYNFALRENIGDVSSRGEAQVVLGNLMGLGIGVVVSAVLAKISGGLTGNLTCFAVLATMHMWCTLSAVRTVNLNTLNWKRLNIVLDGFLRVGEILSVEDVNKREQLMGWSESERLRVGVSLAEYMERSVDVKSALGNSADRFMVLYGKGMVGVALSEDVKVVDILRATLQGKKLLARIKAEEGRLTAERIGQLKSESYKWAGSVFRQFLKGLEKEGWSTSKLVISLGDSRYREANDAEWT